MSRRYLFGPVTHAFAEEFLPEARQTGACLAFGPANDVDLRIEPGDDWDTVVRRLPAGWQPDFVALHLQYTQIPAGLWRAPVPLIGLGGDWNLQWHWYRQCLEYCDLVLTDVMGVETLQREGITHFAHAYLYGLGRSWLANEPLPTERDIDVLFVGNVHPAVQRERLPWLERIARLADRYRIALRTGVFGAEYRRLMRRARIVFKRSIRGEANCRAYEAIAAGALLFQEDGNRELPSLLETGRECVYYTPDNLETLLEHFLAHEEERSAIAEAARCKLPHFTFSSLWQTAVGQIEEAWPDVLERFHKRNASDAIPPVNSTVWEALGQGAVTNEVIAAVQAVSAKEPERADLNHHLAVLRAQAADPSSRLPIAALAAEFVRIFQLDRMNVPAALNAAECHARTGQLEAAIELARAGLQALAELPSVEECQPTWPELGHVPAVFDLFRVEWERAAWENAGDWRAESVAKRTLLRWRIHLLLGEFTNDLDHHLAAVAARPDMPVSQATLGCALARADRIPESVEHLRLAVAGNPFDRPAARALCEALKLTGECGEQDRLVRDSRLLSCAAPALIPVEPWFASPSGAPDAVRRVARVRNLDSQAFRRRYPSVDTTQALCGFTGPRDTQVVLSLLVHQQPKRIGEIGTAAGHMTANLTEWSPNDAVVFTLGTLTDEPTRNGSPQDPETPPRAQFGRYADHFGKAFKVLFITADSLRYDFRRLGALDFAFIDGAHDMTHVVSDSRKVYEQLTPGGCLVWHDFGSCEPWVEVQRALEEVAFSETIYTVAGTEVAFLHKGGQAGEAEDLARDQVLAGSQASVEHALAPERALHIVWEGAFTVAHSLAAVNRALCRELIEHGHDLSIQPVTRDELSGAPHWPCPPELAACCGRPTDRPADVHVRHLWPPNFAPPEAGRLVVMQPWEFGSLPRAWLAPMNEIVEEVWVYSRYLRDCYVASGVRPDRVHVIPLGVDAAQFRPDAPSYPLRTAKKFRFLFVGGTIYRKGIDILLEAYTRTFTAADDVCLVIKDMGVGSFYQGQTAEHHIAALQAKAGAPEIEYLTDNLSADELAGLYTACQCLVAPYRGEGFGLPIAEALACGLPVIVTNHGAALDFCIPAHAYLIDAPVVHFEQKRVGSIETVDFPFLAEPSVDSLGQLLLHVAAHQEEAQAKGRAGSAVVRANLTWERSAATVEARLRQLCSSRSCASASLPVRREKRASVSLCLIVKNEESNLPACLQSTAGLADEVIVVDTGSTDRTKELAVGMGARVFEFPWVDSFAAARNECIRHATGEWIFWMDADDRLDTDNRSKLQKLFADLPEQNLGFSMKCLCLPDPENKTHTVVDHIRLFRNDPQIRWRYRVHEQILPAIRRADGSVCFTDIVIEHTGYQDTALRRRKLDRDLRLLELDRQELGEDPFVLFNLGSILLELGRVQEALPPLQQSLERSHPSDSIVRKLYALIVQCHRQLGQSDEALAGCRAGRRLFPDDAEIIFQEALVRTELHEFGEAEACLLELIQGRESEHFSSAATGLRSFRARHNLATLYRDQGRAVEAERQWRTAIQEASDFRPAWLGLGELLIGQQRFGEAEGTLMHLEGREAALLRVRLLLGRREFDEALRVLTDLIQREPDALAPRMLLTHALLQQGANWAAAEGSLREVLRLDPENLEAHHNMGVLYEMQGRKVDWATERRLMLVALYRGVCTTPSDLNEHCPVLQQLAMRCRHVTDLGTGNAIAATAFLQAHPESLICYDNQPSPQADLLGRLAGNTRFAFVLADPYRVDIEETDLLFIHGCSSAERLNLLLGQHAGRVRKYLLLHGTAGGRASHDSVALVIMQLVNRGEFRIKQHYQSCCGLTVLERVLAHGGKNGSQWTVSL